MNSVSETLYPNSWKKPPFIQRSWLRWSIIIGSIIYLIAALSSMDINIQRVLEGIPRGQRFIESFFPPNFSDNRFASIMESTVQQPVSLLIQLSLTESYVL